VRAGLVVAFVVAAGMALASRGPQTSVPTPGGSARQIFSEPNPLAEVRVWLDGVRLHTPGTRDEATGRVAAVSPESLERLFPYILTMADLATIPPTSGDGGDDRLGRPSNKERDRLVSQARFRVPVDTRAHLAENVSQAFSNPDAFLFLAATLHADSAMLYQAEMARAGRGASTPPGLLRYLQPRYVVGLSDRDDPRRIAIDGLHWQIARWLLTFVSQRPGAVESLRTWYEGTTAFLAGDGNIPELDSHLAAALQRLPNDASMIYLSGWYQEMLASSGVQNAAREFAERRIALKRPLGGPAAPAAYRPTGIRSASEHLEQAERLFTRALERNPKLLEARMRLGRVVGQRKRHAAAIEHLQRVLTASPPDPATAFDAHLFLGVSQEALGRPDAAAEAYRAALALFPSSQSARLALSLLQHAGGDRTNAADTLRVPQTGDAGLPRSADPWWTYHIGPGRHVDDALAAVWARTSEMRPQ
jgi:tetratricopeptide (TPR) repeat protein